MNTPSMLKGISLFPTYDTTAPNEEPMSQQQHLPTQSSLALSNKNSKDEEREEKSSDDEGKRQWEQFITKSNSQSSTAKYWEWCYGASASSTQSFQSQSTRGRPDLPLKSWYVASHMEMSRELQRKI
jgi:hypothetical protein